MTEFLQVLALAAVPPVGAFAGGLLAEWLDVSKKRLSLALHAAAGILLGIVAIELLPEALRAESQVVIFLAFGLGGAAFILADRAIDAAAARFGGGAGGGGPWVIYSGVAVDLFSDGVMIGTGSTIGFSLALLLALAQAPANVPEGFATVGTFKAQGVSRRRRLLMAASLALPILLGAAGSYWLLREQPEIWKLALLAFTAGYLTTVTVEEVIPEAHADAKGALARVAFVGGFFAFAMFTVVFGG